MIFQYNHEAEYAGFGGPGSRPVYIKKSKVRVRLEDALARMRKLMRSGANPGD